MNAIDLKRRAIELRPTLPILLALNGGYVDTAGFLSLQGLFTAHVTGNFVTLGASLALGTSGVLAKLLALPLFCVVVIIVRLLSHLLMDHGQPVLQPMLALQILLLMAGAALAIRLGPFTDGDAWPALLTGMTLVSAMTIQNVVHRSHLGSAPPSTMMTGTTTQIMIEVADMLPGTPPELRRVARARLLRPAAHVATFAVGCGAAALFFVNLGAWCFAIPPVIVAAALLSPIPDAR